MGRIRDLVQFGREDGKVKQSGPGCSMISIILRDPTQDVLTYYNSQKPRLYSVTIIQQKKSDVCSMHGNCGFPAHDL